MSLIGFNPVSWFESAVNAKMEREAAVSLLSTALSSWIAWMWGLSSLPVVGKAFGYAARCAYLSLLHSHALDGLTIAVPDDLASAENVAGIAVTVFHR